MIKLKDFKAAYREQGAYHRQAQGFRAWFLADNYRAIAVRCPARGEILDLACGEGCLAGLLPGRRLVGVDFSPDALRLNRELYGDGYAELHLHDISRLSELPFRAAQFGAVVCSLSLMYLYGEGLGRCLQDVKRLLDAGGRFIFTYPTVGPHRKASAEAVELDPETLAAVLDRAGFGVSELQPFAPLVPADVVEQSAREGTREAARAAYQAAKARMTLPTSYHFVCVASPRTP